MGTKRTGERPQPIASEPVDQHGLAAALRRFVDGFVVDDKQNQIYKRLLSSERRIETLGGLVRWMAGQTMALAGTDRSPAGLQARFGEVIGVVLDASGGRRTTIARALELGRGQSSLFIGDTGRIALITATDGLPILCSRP